MNVHMSVVLDRSGSMSSIKYAMEDAYNKFIDEQKQLPGDMTVSLYQFDSRRHYFGAPGPSNPNHDDWYMKVYEEVAVQHVKPLVISPRGGTALYDAVAETIFNTDKTLANRGPSKVMVVIITDGEENSSQEWDSVALAKLIGDRRDEDWEFVFLGANQDAILAASNIGISQDSSLTYAATGVGARAAGQSLSGYTTQLRSTGKAKFSQQDRDDSI